MVSCTVRIEIGTGGIQADADQLDKLARQDRVSPWVGAHPEAELGPLRIPFAQGVQSGVPGTYRRFTHPTRVFLMFPRFVAHGVSPDLLRTYEISPQGSASHE